MTPFPPAPPLAGFIHVRPERTHSKGRKSPNRPDCGKDTAKGKGVRRETGSEGSRRQTSDGHVRPARTLMAAT